ncbi:MAG: hypothetical protein KIB40_12765 [Pantoea sp.]|uniref:Uncharacterized protein n=1 Tax=Pantoea brenneri TaxID=472694 RepID=A0AAX3JC06_9GAMM|nr:MULTISPECIES: hypothetical protein [Pantoea]MBS6033997.1 hypothetical protein [Pantoea sp.]VXC58748.1 conserved hypothetical protein [Pantoea brenneri]
MSNRKASHFELFHNLNMALREDPQFSYEYDYSRETRTLMGTPYWRLTPSQRTSRNTMIEQTMANATAEDTRVRMMAMRPEHRYLLIPTYICLATTEFYQEMQDSLSDEPETVDLMPVMWAAIYALNLGRDMSTDVWKEMSRADQLTQVKWVQKVLSTVKLSRYITDASRAVWLGLFVTFSDIPDDFYDLMESQ